jgi:hypothetical protein
MPDKTAPSRDSEPVFKKGQRVTASDLPYYGVTVEDPNPPGPGMVLLRIKMLPNDVFEDYPKKALRP